MKTLWSILVGCCVVLVLWGCNGQPQQRESQDTPQAAPKGKTRPFITKWKSNGEEDIQIPIIGTYTLTWYNEATPNERHTEQVTVEIDDNTKIDVERVKPYSFMPPTEGVYVVEAGPEGVEGMYMTFYGSQQIYAPKLLSVVQFGDVVWKRLEYAFCDCESMQFAEGIDTPDLSQCTSLKGMFSSCSAFNHPLEHWDVSHVTDMSNMLSGCHAFNQPLEKWDVSHVTDMNSLFCNCWSFNQPLEGWDVRQVTDMERAFFGCKVFNQPLAQWDVRQVTNLHNTFSHCSAFNQPLERWDVSNVTDMACLFKECMLFNQPLNSWDVSRVTNMAMMFENCKNFNQPLDAWNVGKVKGMSSMFSGCASFNQSLEAWDVSQVTSMWRMFSGCSLFNQPLNQWDVSKVETMGEMFKGCTSFDQSLDAWNISSVNKAHKDGIGGIFDGCPAGELPFVAEWKAQGVSPRSRRVVRLAPQHEGYKPYAAAGDNT